MVNTKHVDVNMLSMRFLDQNIDRLCYKRKELMRTMIWRDGS